MTRHRVAFLAASLLAASAVTLVAPTPAAYAAGDTCDSITAPDVERGQAPDPSEPVADLRIEEAHEVLGRRGLVPGDGAVVAVVDSGIAPVPGLRLGAANDLTDTPGELSDWHGTAMAGVIAGPKDGDELVGIAPGAEVVDVRVYDTLDPSDDGETRLTPDGVAEGLRWVAENQRALGIDIVLAPMPVDRTEEMTDAVDELDRRDVIVVAASGDRPDGQNDPLFDEFGDDADQDSEEESDDSEPAAGEDAAGDSWPAGYDSVVAVSTTVPEGDATSIVLQNSAIDVAAPTDGGVSYGMNNKTCVTPAPSSAWAAAEVAGVLALLETAYAGETAEQLVARLESTATGTEVTPNNVLTGHGIIQPLEALDRPLRPAKDGTIASSRVHDRGNVPVAIPESEPDLLASTRENALWWGLLGGGALLVAMVLRPVLSRRRR